MCLYYFSYFYVIQFSDRNSRFQLEKLGFLRSREINGEEKKNRVDKVLDGKHIVILSENIEMN